MIKKLYKDIRRIFKIFLPGLTDLGSRYFYENAVLPCCLSYKFNDFFFRLFFIFDFTRFALYIVKFIINVT